MQDSFSPDSCRNPALRRCIDNDWHWLSIDPGLSGTGIALWKGSKLQGTDNLHFHGFAEWNFNATVMVQRLKELYLFHYDIYFICYELPAFMQRAQMQNAKQDIVKLTMFAGMIHGLSTEYVKVPTNLMMNGLYDAICPVRILDWKGQVEKKLMNERTIKACKRNPERIAMTKPLESIKTTHEIDAIGIGLYMLGMTQ
jgi:hypothetical protein